MNLSLESIAEELPGAIIAARFRALWPTYRAWYLSAGAAPRPSYLECERAMKRYMPELAPTWLAFAELVGGGDLEARFLSLWRPPPYIAGCTQAFWCDDEPVLIRNYDYAPRLYEGVVWRSRWRTRAVLGQSDCLIGLLDGINDAGLAVSLNFGGKPEVADGFGAPLLVRYLLETCATVGEAAAAIRRVPTHMAYNLLVVDREGDFTTAFTRPGGPAVLRRVPVSTNHQGKIEWEKYAAASATIERERHVIALMSDTELTTATLTDAFLETPLRVTDYARGFGTIYTAVYWPRRGEVNFLWPGESWTLGLDRFRAERRSISPPLG